MQRLLQKIGSMLFISVLLLAITNEAIAQNGAQTITNVVVVKPINKSKIDVFFENLIQRNLQEAIASNNGYKAVINESVDAILQESSFKQSGLISESQRARIAALGGIDKVCVSEMKQYEIRGETYMDIDAKFVDLKTGKVGEVKNVYFKIGINYIRSLAKQLTEPKIHLEANVAASQKQVQPQNDKEKSIKMTVTNGIDFKMIFVEGGSFTMGCTGEQAPCDADERPAHFVSLEDYYIGETEVTQILWETVMKTTVADQRNKVKSDYYLVGVGDQNPMYYISYEDCKAFCDALNKLLKNKIPAGYRFAIPTEAQWEYAARGGQKSKATTFSGDANIDKVAWYESNSTGETKAVKQKAPNELGIYDMTGNVWEWCIDKYAPNFYTTSPANNPKNVKDGTGYVYRGGGWRSSDVSSRIANRSNGTIDYRNYTVGFRFVLTK